MTYQVIYADPPWRYNFSKSRSRKIENHYQTMTLTDICELDIPSADNSVLYLWATAPKIQEAFTVLGAWGFDYKSQAVWDKELMGMGYWFRGQHEILLVGTKGKFSPPKLKTRSVFRVRRNKHSKKPQEVIDYLSEAFPNENKLELFARSQTNGWDNWGNELETGIKL